MCKRKQAFYPVMQGQASEEDVDILGDTRPEPPPKRKKKRTKPPADEEKRKKKPKEEGSAPAAPKAQPEKVWSYAACSA